MATNVYCTLPRRNLRALKQRAVVDDAPQPKKRNSLCNQGINGNSNPEAYNSLPRRILRSVRKSLNREPTLRFRTDEERALHEALEAENAADEDEYDPSKPAMKFQFPGKHSNDPEVQTYFHQHNLDMDKVSLGGMIMMHQYCYLKYKTTREPIYRDAANFWKEADWEHFDLNDRIPIRMVYLRLYTCEKVEPWYRDHYTNCNQARHNMRTFGRDRLTGNDMLFDNLGREAFSMMTKEMHMVEKFCLFEFCVTKNKEYEKGLDFWQKASPLGFPRNYQLALLHAKKGKWEHKEVDEWFGMLYKEQCYRGAREFDYYPPVDGH